MSRQIGLGEHAASKNDNHTPTQQQIKWIGKADRDPKEPRGKKKEERREKKRDRKD